MPSVALEDTMQASAAAGDPAPANDVPPPHNYRRYGAGRLTAPLVAVPADGLGWSASDLEELDHTAPGLLPGRIVKCDQSGALVLMSSGAARATYCAALLLAAARARAGGRVWPRPGDRVALRRWPDGPITVEGVVV
jgi:hypothetical protein